MTIAVPLPDLQFQLDLARPVFFLIPDPILGYLCGEGHIRLVQLDLDVEDVGPQGPVLQQDVLQVFKAVDIALGKLPAGLLQRFERASGVSLHIFDVQEGKLPVGFAGNADEVVKRIVGNLDIHAGHILDNLADDFAGQLRALVFHGDAQGVFLRDEVGGPVAVLVHLGHGNRDAVRQAEDVQVNTDGEFADEIDGVQAALDQVVNLIQQAGQPEQRQLDIRIFLQFGSADRVLGGFAIQSTGSELEQDPDKGFLRLVVILFIIFVVFFAVLFLVAPEVQEDPALGDVDLGDGQVCDGEFFTIVTHLIGDKILRFVLVHVPAVEEGRIFRHLKDHGVGLGLLLPVLFLFRLVVVLLVIDDALFGGVELQQIQQLFKQLVALRAQLVRQLVIAALRGGPHILRQLVKPGFTRFLQLFKPFAVFFLCLAGIPVHEVLELFQQAVLRGQLADAVGNAVILRYPNRLLPGFGFIALVILRLAQLDKLYGFPLRVVAFLFLLLDQELHGIGMVFLFQVDIPFLFHRDLIRRHVGEGNSIGFLQQAVQFVPVVVVVRIIRIAVGTVRVAAGLVAVRIIEIAGNLLFRLAHRSVLVGLRRNGNDHGPGMFVIDIGILFRFGRLVFRKLINIQAVIAEEEVQHLLIPEYTLIRIFESNLNIELSVLDILRHGSVFRQVVKADQRLQGKAECLRFPALRGALHGLFHRQRKITAQVVGHVAGPGVGAFIEVGPFAGLLVIIRPFAGLIVIVGGIGRAVAGDLALDHVIHDFNLVLAGVFLLLVARQAGNRPLPVIRRRHFDRPDQLVMAVDDRQGDLLRPAAVGVVLVVPGLPPAQRHIVFVFAVDPPVFNRKPGQVSSARDAPLGFSEALLFVRIARPEHRGEFAFLHEVFIGHAVRIQGPERIAGCVLGEFDGNILAHSCLGRFGNGAGIHRFGAVFAAAVQCQRQPVRNRGISLVRVRLDDPGFGRVNGHVLLKHIDDGEGIVYLSVVLDRDFRAAVHRDKRFAGAAVQVGNVLLELHSGRNGFKRGSVRKQMGPGPVIRRVQGNRRPIACPLAGIAVLLPQPGRDLRQAVRVLAVFRVPGLADADIAFLVSGPDIQDIHAGNDGVIIGLLRKIQYGRQFLGDGVLLVFRIDAVVAQRPGPHDPVDHGGAFTRLGKGNRRFPVNHDLCPGSVSRHFPHMDLHPVRIDRVQRVRIRLPVLDAAEDVGFVLLHGDVDHRAGQLVIVIEVLHLAGDGGIEIHRHGQGHVDLVFIFQYLAQVVIRQFLYPVILRNAVAVFGNDHIPGPAQILIRAADSHAAGGNMRHVHGQSVRFGDIRQGNRVPRHRIGHEGPVRAILPVALLRFGQEGQIHVRRPEFLGNAYPALVKVHAGHGPKGDPAGGDVPDLACFIRGLEFCLVVPDRLAVAPYRRADGIDRKSVVPGSRVLIRRIMDNIAPFVQHPGTVAGRHDLAVNGGIGRQSVLHHAPVGFGVAGRAQLINQGLGLVIMLRIHHGFPFGAVPALESHLHAFRLVQPVCIRVPDDGHVQRCPGFLQAQLDINGIIVAPDDVRSLRAGADLVLAVNRTRRHDLIAGFFLVGQIEICLTAVLCRVPKIGFARRVRRGIPGRIDGKAVHADAAGLAQPDADRHPVPDMRAGTVPQARFFRQGIVLVPGFQFLFPLGGDIHGPFLKIDIHLARIGIFPFGHIVKGQAAGLPFFRADMDAGGRAAAVRLEGILFPPGFGIDAGLSVEGNGKQRADVLVDDRDMVAQEAAHIFKVRADIDVDILVGIGGIGKIRAGAAHVEVGVVHAAGEVLHVGKPDAEGPAHRIGQVARHMHRRAVKGNDHPVGDGQAELRRQGNVDLPDLLRFLAAGGAGAREFKFARGRQAQFHVKTEAPGRDVDIRPKVAVVQVRQEIVHPAGPVGAGQILGKRVFEEAVHAFRPRAVGRGDPPVAEQAVQRHRFRIGQGDDLRAVFSRAFAVKQEHGIVRHLRAEEGNAVLARKQPLGDRRGHGGCAFIFRKGNGILFSLVLRDHEDGIPVDQVVPGFGFPAVNQAQPGAVAVVGKFMGIGRVFRRGRVFPHARAGIAFRHCPVHGVHKGLGNQAVRVRRQHNLRLGGRRFPAVGQGSQRKHKQQKQQEEAGSTFHTETSSL